MARTEKSEGNRKGGTMTKTVQGRKLGSTFLNEYACLDDATRKILIVAINNARQKLEEMDIM